MVSRRREIQIRLDFWSTALDKLRAAYVALVEGGVKSYMLDDRQLTKFDVPALSEEIIQAENRVDELTNMLNGGRNRKAFGIVPRDDW